MWVKSTVNGRSVYTETVTLSNASTANGSTIGFVPKGADFHVFINTGSVNTVGAVTTDLEGSFDDSTWVDENTTFAADCDSAMVNTVYDNSASGDYPYFRLSFDSVADDSALSIVVKVIV